MHENAKISTDTLKGFSNMIFICSPYRGDVEKNVTKARELCNLCAKEGLFGFAPHLYFPQFTDDSVYWEREFGINQGKLLMQVCSEVWVFGEEITEGMLQEVECARGLDKPVSYISDIDGWKQAIIERGMS